MKGLWENQNDDTTVNTYKKFSTKCNFIISRHKHTTLCGAYEFCEMLETQSRRSRTCKMLHTREPIMTQRVFNDN